MTTVSDDMSERLIGYIGDNARKDTDAIRALVEKGHAQIMGNLQSMSDEQARFKPAPDVWSALEVMAHVVTTKRGTARISERLARGEVPAGFGGEGEDNRSAQDGIARETFRSVAEASAAAQAGHDALLAFVDSLSPETNTEARYNHFVFGDLNCREWAVFQRVHDGDHAQQLDQIKATDGYPK
jgi:hypothetical protein